MIEVKNAVKSFEGNRALDGINLNINSGCAFGLLGSNGAGKSTLLRLISGIYTATEGEIIVNGEPVYENTSAKQKLVLIGDETIQWNNYTLNEMKEFHKTFYNSFSDTRFTDLWNIMKLPLNKKLSTFSKGMKRQSVMVCALAVRPAYLFMDEAFDGLDPTMRLIVRQMLSEAMSEAEMTTVISSHNLKEIDEFCDKAALLHKGKLVFDRELDSLKGDIHKYQTVFAKEPTDGQLAELTILKSEQQGSVTSMIIRGSESFVRQKLSVFDPKFVDILPLTLEEIFIYEMEAMGYEYTGGIDS
ncbi:MAG: ABC transporter ATP-binding protein [Oscillospiraceae bacterium]|nr:ABC transporter ATP-binding protein [Oscillospiraceae bacterium]